MKLNASRKLAVTLLLAFLTVFSGLVINALTGKPEFNAWLENNYFGVAVLILIVVVTVSLILYFTYVLFKNDQQSEQSIEKENLSEDNEADVKRYYDSLKERYRKRYESKLDGRFEITLEVSENWDGGDTKNFKGEYEVEGQISEAFEYINSAFEKHGRLLIVGSPGVGKTVLLLKLALELLEKTDIEKKEAFPVIFNLASWSDEYNNFDDWLLSVLNSGEGLSKDFAGKLLQEERIIFFLDGLDELARNEDEETAAEIRAKCLQSLNEYLDRGKQAVICCRVIEFELMQMLTGKDAPVSVKVKINDLSPKEILESLRTAKENKTDKAAAENLSRILKNDENKELLKVLSKPFYFNTALEVFDKQNFDEADLSKDTKGLENYLQEKFIEKKLNKTLNPNEFDKDKTIKWFEWLSKLMEKKQKISFELADLQPTDLTKNRFNNFYNKYVMSYFAVILGYRVYELLDRTDYKKIIPEDSIDIKISKAFATSSPLFRSFTVELLFNFFIQIIGGAGLGILFGFFNDNGIFINILSGLAFSVIPFCFYTFFGCLENAKEIKKIAYLKNSYQRLRGGFSLNLIVGSILLIFFIFGWYFTYSINYKVKNLYLYGSEIDYFLLLTSIQISENENSEDAEEAITTNEEIWEEFLTLRKIYNNADIPFEIKLLITILDWFPTGIFLCGIFPIILRILATPLMRHLVLRYFLWREGVIPLKYASFLDYAAESRILEKDGGHWRFRHHNLQDYFAGLDEQSESSMGKQKV